MRSICVFCGSSMPQETAYTETAKRLGELLAEREIRLVYGGADVGLMGTVANACLGRGGTVVGVMPQHLVDLEVAHGGLTDLKVVDTMHERKRVMSDLSDGFIALPGGIGTLEETFEIFTWLQLGLHTKPLGLLNPKGFYDHLNRFLSHMTGEGFLMDFHRAMLMVESECDALLDRFENYRPIAREKWFDKRQHKAS